MLLRDQGHFVLEQDLCGDFGASFEFSGYAPNVLIDLHMTGIGRRLTGNSAKEDHFSVYTRPRQHVLFFTARPEGPRSTNNDEAD